jgi:hypothetical protein
VVGAHKKSSVDVQKMMEMLVNDNDVNDWKDELEEVMVSYRVSIRGHVVPPLGKIEN